MTVLSIKRYALQKADILDMERQIREIEQEMKHLSGERLEERMNTYQRLTAAFERENGYACESEITGVFKKDLDLQKKNSQNRSRLYPEVRKPVSLSENCSSQSRIFCFWTSQPTIWI